MSKVSAALIAVVCWIGIALQFSATFSHTHNVVATAWTLARFFTIICNLALGMAMSTLALGRRLSAFLMSGLTLAILLVGIVYLILLRGLHPLSGAALIADYLLHYVSPSATAIYWLLFVPRGKLRWNAPWLWSLFPVAYFLYVLGRGQLDQRYPYPFIDLTKLGWIQVLLNGAGIAFGFILAGFLLVWIDRWRPLGPSRARR